MISKELAAEYEGALRDAFGFKYIEWYDLENRKVKSVPLNCCDRIMTIPWKRTKEYDHYHKIEYCAVHEIAHIYTKHTRSMEDS